MLKLNKRTKLKSYLNVFRSVATLSISLGVDPRKILLLRHFPKFLKHRRFWKSQGGTITKNHMILSGFVGSAGNARGHYFHQDLLVAQFIFKNNPRRHIDVASRIDGFVAHVASYRKLEILDVRPFPKSEHPNIQFIQADLTKDVNLGPTDSLSCLHALEHFGLGRYSDPIDVNGHISGIKNMINMISKDGRLYVSVPISTKEGVHFNAHRVFAVKSVPELPIVQNNMVLERFDFVDDNGVLFLEEDINRSFSEIGFCCGIYTFRRKTDALVI